LIRPSPLPPSARALLLAALVALAGVAAPVAAQDQVILRAFGDSITDGFGDTTQNHGYPARLERWLRQRGWDATVSKHGRGGETTSQGLSRIDDVLELGGDFLLLMEGTNDVSKHVGIETIRFNLDEMASRAEVLGMIAVHATVIPRIPTAPVDSDNSRTSQVAEAILELGELRHRAVADNFHAFEELPDVFDNYYYFDPDQEPPDPVGHPNSDGYQQIAGVFLETLLPILDADSIQIVPPGTSGPAGILLAFGVDASDAIERVEWDFGDGGVLVRELPESLSAYYVFREPGTYNVSVRGFTAGGGEAADSDALHVTREPLHRPAKARRFAAVESRDRVVSDLTLTNAGGEVALIEAALVLDIRYDEPPLPRRYLLLPGEQVFVPDLMGSDFALPGNRGSLLVELLAPGSANPLSAALELRAPTDLDGGDGCTVVPQAPDSWNAAPKNIQNIVLLPDESATIHVTNLDDVAGSARMDLFDGGSGFIGSALFDLAAGSSRQRTLGDLFRGLDGRSQPFRANFVSSGVRYSAAIVAAGHGEDVKCAVAAP
jgi:lysophospholipase L1-like esterase